MVDTPHDPLDQARGVWSDALALLRQNPKLSARDKGWLENVVPEGMWGACPVRPPSRRCRPN